MLTDTDGDSAAPEYAETRSTTVVIGRPMIDAITIETSIVVSNHASGRGYHVNLHTENDVVEFNPLRARDAANKFRRIAADLDTLADDADRLTALEAETKALLDGRARTADTA
jgi:hypothetical protein